MIYFVQLETGSIKIGYTDDLPVRVRKLDAHYGSPVVLLATMPGGYEEEQELHRRFARLRLGDTEQFRPARELLEFIGMPILASANPDAVLRTRPVCDAVRLPADILAKARHIALERKLKVSEYLAQIIRGPLDRDWKDTRRQIAEKD